MPRKQKQTNTKVHAYGVRLRKGIDMNKLQKNPELARQLMAHAQSLRDMASGKLHADPSPNEADQDVEQTTDNELGNASIKSQSSENVAEALMELFPQISGSTKAGKLIYVFAQQPATDPDTGEDVDVVMGYTTPNEPSIKSVKVNLEGLDTTKVSRFDKMKQIIKNTSGLIADKNMPDVQINETSNGGYEVTEAEPTYTLEGRRAASVRFDPTQLYFNTVTNMPMQLSLGGTQIEHHIMKPIIKPFTQSASQIRAISTGVGFFPALLNIGKSVLSNTVGTLVNTAANTVTEVLNGTVNAVA